MANLIVYYAHPGHKFSHVNRFMATAAESVDGITSVDLYRDYPRFDINVDVENAEAKKYDIVVTPKADSPLAGVDGVYEHGMVQPGVVVENADGKILYRWAITPSPENFGGATDRPLVADIVGALEHIIANGSAPGEFGSTDMAYLEQNHPDQHKVVMDFLASMK